MFRSTNAISEITKVFKLLQLFFRKTDLLKNSLNYRVFCRNDSWLESLDSVRCRSLFTYSWPGLWTPGRPPYTCRHLSPSSVSGSDSGDSSGGTGPPGEETPSMVNPASRGGDRP